MYSVFLGATTTGEVEELSATLLVVSKQSTQVTVKRLEKSELLSQGSAEESPRQGANGEVTVQAFDKSHRSTCTNGRTPAHDLHACVRRSAIFLSV